ncbi:MAG: ECF transporter S component [Ruminococcaceae bacterium]|nr:ECF transporter S component [Oscillospiraceae bacterium]
MTKTRKALLNLVLSAMFIALCIVLPFFTGQIPQIGSMLLPMHIPVLLCGLICGWQYGAAVGFIAPLLRSMLFSMPPFITAMAMAVELMTYGFVTGFLYGKCKWKCIVSLYRTLLVAMIAGRGVWGIFMTIIMGVTDELFTWQIFISGAFINAIPGIILQLILIPAIMLALGKTGLVHFYRKRPSEAKKNIL